MTRESKEDKLERNWMDELHVCGLFVGCLWLDRIIMSANHDMIAWLMGTGKQIAQG